MVYNILFNSVAIVAKYWFGENDIVELLITVGGAVFSCRSCIFLFFVFVDCPFEYGKRYARHHIAQVDCVN